VSATIPVGTSPSGVAISPDGSFSYVAVSDGQQVARIDTATNTVSATIEVSHRPFAVAISPDGSFALVVDNSSPGLVRLSESESCRNAGPVGPVEGA
jgi:large repetitive protein